MTDTNGGCVYLEAEDGRRYELLLPPGWTARAIAGQLISPDGHIAAVAGETLSLRGSVADGLISRCQLGPLFEVIEIDSP